MLAALVVAPLLLGVVTDVGLGVQAAAFVQIPSSSLAVVPTATATLLLRCSFGALSVGNVAAIGAAGAPSVGDAGPAVSDTIVVGWQLRLDDGVSVIAGGGAAIDVFLLSCGDCEYGVLAGGPAALVSARLPFAEDLALELTASVAGEFSLGAFAVCFRPAASVALVYRFGGGA